MVMIQSETFSKIKKMLFFCYGITCYGITDHCILKIHQKHQNIIFNPISLGTVFPGIIVSSKAMLKIIRWFYKKIWWF